VRLLQANLHFVGEASLQIANPDMSLCLDLEVILFMFVKHMQQNLRSLLVPSKPRERRKAFGANYLPILGQTSHTVHNKHEGLNFYLCHPFYPQNKISPVKFEGQFTTRNERMPG